MPQKSGKIGAAKIGGGAGVLRGGDSGDPLAEIWPGAGAWGAPISSSTIWRRSSLSLGSGRATPSISSSRERISSYAARAALLPLE